MENFSLDKQMKKLFLFVNFDTKTNDEDQFLTLAMKYLSFAYPWKDVSKKYSAMSSLYIDAEGNKSEGLPKLMKKLQKRMVEILESIIDPQKESEPIELKGTRTISFKNQQMVELFETEIPKSKKISFPTEKKVMEASFIDLISNEEVVLKRFKRCQNDRCGKYIYEPKKLYCSDRCSNAYRQRHKTVK
jgi:hypothetical protein